MKNKRLTMVIVIIGLLLFVYLVMRNNKVPKNPMEAWNPPIIPTEDELVDESFCNMDAITNIDEAYSWCMDAVGICKKGDWLDEMTAMASSGLNEYSCTECCV